MKSPLNLKIRFKWEGTSHKKEENLQPLQKHYQGKSRTKKEKKIA